ncbi:hypothetical protein SAICODRAFT_186615 [Saitoella complicata NRRL Y-17804]|uniref:uncharacterized protein n=1 Tax=Saitoella complicata (strain BCRC 22490 / CBS 7301 / JCM 7358 / NBRC 10748 / NRRL Y-17804) TaxID=698492 RepID=UPI0008670B2E|nr:uncharacterized protein SAICODRAFT_186615 [Saitoella complicata NRRL Y-17804]ODQ55527.1 hypothetical protein SAICODRAFT_186615 [Saitoella complicata NRRL Y-17804]
MLCLLQLIFSSLTAPTATAEEEACKEAIYAFHNDFSGIVNECWGTRTITSASGPGTGAAVVPAMMSAVAKSKIASFMIEFLRVNLGVCTSEVAGPVVYTDLRLSCRLCILRQRGAWRTQPREPPISRSFMTYVGRPRLL